MIMLVGTGQVIKLPGSCQVILLVGPYQVFLLVGPSQEIMLAGLCQATACPAGAYCTFVSCSPNIHTLVREGIKIKKLGKISEIDAMDAIDAMDEMDDKLGLSCAKLRANFAWLGLEI